MAKLPTTIKEAAESILNDLSLNEQKLLFQLTQSQYKYMFEKINHHIAEDFHLYKGNNKLLEQCRQINRKVPEKAIYDMVYNILVSYYRAFNIIAQWSKK